MGAARLLPVAALLLLALAAEASRLEVLTETWRGTTDTEPEFSVFGQAEYFNDAGGLGIGVTMQGALAVWDSYRDQVLYVPWSTLGGQWQYSSKYVGYASNCYRSSMNAQTFDQYGEDISDTIVCNGTPPSSGGGCQAWGGCNAEWDENDWEWARCPLLVNTGRAAWRLTGAEAPVLFDMDADGVEEALGWPDAESSLAFVALDANGNGAIDDGAELFGVGTPLPWGVNAANGFEALRQHDTNRDSEIDSADAIWHRLLLWTDANHDGVSTPAELQALSSSGITSLSVTYRVVGRRDEHGNMLRYQGFASSQDAVQPFYDVFLRRFW